MYTAIEMRKRYIVYLRALLSLSLLLIGLYNYAFVLDQPVLTGAYFFILVLSNFVFMALPAVKYRGIRLHYFVFMMDMAFIIAGAYIFTSLDIQLIMAIFLTIFIAALSRSTGFSLLIALVVNAVYLYITVAAGGEGPGLMNDKILLNIPFIFIIALHSSYLAEKGEEENREKINLDKINILLTKKATGKSREMSALIDFTENIFDSLTFAFIIFDTGGRVKIFNEKAEQLTGINKKRAEEAPINSLSALGGIRDVIMDVKFKKNEVKGRKASGGVKKREFIIDAGIIKGKSGNETGIFCIINEEGGNER